MLIAFPYHFCANAYLLPMSYGSRHDAQYNMTIRSSLQRFRRKNRIISMLSSETFLFLFGA